MSSSSNSAVQRSIDWRLPGWCWVNALSLDAVLVGVTWQIAFASEFSADGPRIDDSLIIGLSIWIVYTADHLLDAFRLDCGKPHCMRHRFHRDYRGALSICWILAIAAVTAMSVRCATESQLRWGLVATATAVSYLVAVQHPRFVQTRIPKEAFAGLVFAFGVSLPAWADPRIDAGLGLVLATGLSAFLFASNCVTIAILDRKVDREQGVASLATRYPSIATRLHPLLFGFAGLVAVIAAVQPFSPMISFGLVAGGIGLAVVNLVRARSSTEDPVRKGDRRFAAAADLALIIPLAIGGLLGRICG